MGLKSYPIIFPLRPWCTSVGLVRSCLTLVRTLLGELLLLSALKGQCMHKNQSKSKLTSLFVFPSYCVLALNFKFQFLLIVPLFSFFQDQPTSLIFSSHIFQTTHFPSLFNFSKPIFLSHYIFISLHFMPFIGLSRPLLSFKLLIPLFFLLCSHGWLISCLFNHGINKLGRLLAKNTIVSKWSSHCEVRVVRRGRSVCERVAR